MEKPLYLSLLLLVLTEARIPNTLVILSAANGPLYWLLLLLVLAVAFLVCHSRRESAFALA